ncbi:MAG: hypothetical protein H8E19_17990 [Deltaproteobacteria bacterium]|uniref:Endonuclease n=1 Tax=Candidatus Desulfacyla euxinica TaxID=2841693 RepID=A0A8J6N3H5_9DELT|nr:hypothetical protein [Candidatus Desulfacyla euxinica]
MRRIGAAAARVLLPLAQAPGVAAAGPEFPIHIFTMNIPVHNDSSMRSA